MLGQQRRRQLLPVGLLAAGDHALRHDRREPHPLQVPQQPVLAERDVLDGLLDRVDPLLEAHDPHHVTRETARGSGTTQSSDHSASGVDHGSVTIAGSGRLATIRRAMG